MWCADNLSKQFGPRSELTDGVSKKKKSKTKSVDDNKSMKNHTTCKNLKSGNSCYFRGTKQPTAPPVGHNRTSLGVITPVPTPRTTPRGKLPLTLLWLPFAEMIKLTLYLLVASAENILKPDQAHQNIHLDLGPN